jgi:DNA-binding NarL/FixJ family response regulator/anti-sigma regulatory factor (Ser/Thr protein kinase)
LSSESVPARLAEDMNVLLFESIREILFNVVKHAAVDEAHVDVRYADNRLRITVLDQGLGFDPDSVRSSGTSSRGFGLFSIRERLDLLGGELEIDSAPGKGTRVMLNAPVILASSSSVPGRDALIRIILVDDHPVLRDGLARLFAQEPDIEVVGEASDGRAAIELATKLIPDVVLIDVNMPGLGGIEATRIIRERLPQVKVVGLSMLDDVEVVRAMLAAGASAHLSKSSPTGEIVRAVRASTQGELHSRGPEKTSHKRKSAKTPGRETRSHPIH